MSLLEAAFGPHGAFIAWAYLTSLAIVAVLIGSTVLDHRTQARRLADLDRRGLRRGSDEIS